MAKQKGSIIIEMKNDRASRHELENISYEKPWPKSEGSNGNGMNRNSVASGGDESSNGEMA